MSLIAQAAAGQEPLEYHARSTDIGVREVDFSVQRISEGVPENARF